VPSDPGGGGNERKPFIRLARDRKDDGLNILVYSYVMSDSPSLRLAVQVAGGLAELVQASFVVPHPERPPTDCHNVIQKSVPDADGFHEIAETSSAFVKSLVDVARESHGNTTLASDPLISEFVGYGQAPSSQRSRSNNTIASLAR
jgi:hypothetical protein